MSCALLLPSPATIFSSRKGTHICVPKVSQRRPNVGAAFLSAHGSSPTWTADPDTRKAAPLPARTHTARSRPLAVDRYIAVCHSFLFVSHIGRTRAKETCNISIESTIHTHSSEGRFQGFHCGARPVVAISKNFIKACAICDL